MGGLLNLKNLFTKSKAVKDNKISLNRARAENEIKIAKARNKFVHLFGEGRDRDLRAIFIPRRSKFKGYMRENRRHKKAA